MKNFDQFVWFIFVPERQNKKFGFRTYNDSKNKECGYLIGGDSKSPVYKKWSFDRDSKRMIRVHVDEVDHNGQSAVEFLRNSPECYGSPNGTYQHDGSQIDYYFKEVNEAGEAKKASEILMNKSKALSKAAEVKGQDFIDLCAMIGVLNKPEEIMRHRLMDYAQNFPEPFLALVEDPTRKVRSLVRRALEANVFIKDGPVIKWENKIIGAGEDDAVTNLLKDESLKSTVTDVVKRLS